MKFKWGISPELSVTSNLKERKILFTVSGLPPCYLLQTSYYHKTDVSIRLFLLRATRFRGYRQQDSQELLRYLLDSIQIEELKVIHLKCYFNFNTVAAL